MTKSRAFMIFPPQTHEHGTGTWKLASFHCSSRLIQHSEEFVMKASTKTTDDHVNHCATDVAIPPRVSPHKNHHPQICAPKFLQAHPRKWKSDNLSMAIGLVGSTEGESNNLGRPPPSRSALGGSFHQASAPGKGGHSHDTSPTPGADACLVGKKSQNRCSSFNEWLEDFRKNQASMQAPEPPTCSERGSPSLLG